jgi:hypothetical protein
MCLSCPPCPSCRIVANAHHLHVTGKANTVRLFRYAMAQISTNQREDTILRGSGPNLLVKAQATPACRPGSELACGIPCRIRPIGFAGCLSELTNDAQRVSWAAHGSSLLMQGQRTQLKLSPSSCIIASRSVKSCCLQFQDFGQVVLACRAEDRSAGECPGYFRL